MKHTSDCTTIFSDAWNAHNFDQMLSILQSPDTMPDQLREEERRVFPWMTQASLMRDIALNVLSFWLVDQQTHNPSLSRKLILENHHTRLNSLVCKLQEMNLLIELLESVMSEDTASLEASLVFLEILSPSVKLAEVLRTLFYSVTDADTCLLDSFIEIIRSYINDHSICLLNISSLFDFTVECDFNDTLSEDTDSSPQEYSTLQIPKSKSKRKSKFSYLDEDSEPLGFREGIIKELLILVRELRSKFKLTKIKSTLQQQTQSEFLDAWQLAQFCKAVIRMFGCYESARVLTCSSFEKFFKALNFDIHKCMKKLQKEVLLEDKIRFTDYEETKSSMDSRVYLQRPVLAPVRPSKTTTANSSMPPSPSNQCNQMIVKLDSKGRRFVSSQATGSQCQRCKCSIF